MAEAIPNSDANDRQRWHRPLRSLLGAAMVVMLLVVSTALTGLDYYRARKAALTNAEREMHVFSLRLVDRLSVLSADAVKPVEMITSLANAFIVPPPERANDKIAMLFVGLAHSPEIDGIYAGYPDGSFFHAVSLRSEGWRKALSAPKAATVAIRTIEISADQGRLARLTFLDEHGQPISEGLSTASAYDPRTRPWYVSAIDPTVQTAVGPYRMATTGALGMTISQPHRACAKIVIGADVVLDTIVEYLSAERLTEGTQAFIVDKDGKVIVHAGSRARRSPGPNNAGGDVASPLTVELLAKFVRTESTEPQRARLVESNGRTFLLTVAPIDAGVLLKGHRIAVAAPIDELLADANRALLQGLAISAAVVVAAILLALLLARWITHSLLLLTGGANQLQSLDFATPIDVSSRVSEVWQLGRAMNKARDAIHNFALYVPKEFVRKGIESGFFTGRSARRQEVTALFTDIYDFTTISEQYAPEEVVAMLSDYFDVFGATVPAHGGTIIQFLGDSVFALWNAPAADNDHAANACRCALSVESRLADFNVAQKRKGLPEFRTRYGIHTGMAVVGSVGATDRLQYSAMGDTINVASRLEGMNKNYGTSIIASEAVVSRCSDRIVFRPLGTAQAKGREEALSLFEVIGIAAPVSLDG